MTKNVQQLKERLEKNPLFWIGKTENVICRECLKGAKPSGRKLALSAVTNYNEFHTCGTCKRSARYAPFLA